MSIGSPKSPGPSVILGVVSGLTRTAAEVGRPETQVTHTIQLTSFRKD
jgi:S1-C subfamily serine protease